MTRRSPAFIPRRCFNATGFDTPSQIVVFSFFRSANEYVEGSVFSRESIVPQFDFAVWVQTAAASWASSNLLVDLPASERRSSREPDRRTRRTAPAGASD